MSSSSPRKGKTYERELAKYFSENLGITVFRSCLPQKFDGSGNCDLLGLPQLAVEAKRVETLRWRDAYAQAKRNAAPDEIPIVVTRCSRVATGDSTVMLSLDDFLIFYRAFLASERKVDDKPFPIIDNGP